MSLDYVHPSLHKSIDTLLKDLSSIASIDPPMIKVLLFPWYPLPSNTSPVPPGMYPVPLTLIYWRYFTFPSKVKLAAALVHTHKVVQALDIMDIGSYSIRLEQYLSVSKRRSIILYPLFKQCSLKETLKPPHRRR